MAYAQEDGLKSDTELEKRKKNETDARSRRASEIDTGCCPEKN